MSEAEADDLDTFACPPHLTGEARELWEKMVPLLLHEGELLSFDKEALTMMCEAWQEWRENTEAARKAGRYYRRPGGLLAVHPAYKLAERAQKQLFYFFRQFGMTPMDRMRLRSGRPPKQEDDDRDDFGRFRKGLGS